MAKEGRGGGSSLSGRSGWRMAGIVALVLFLIVDVALVYLALTANDPTEQPAGASGTPASTPPPSEPPTDEEPAEEPEPEPEPAVAVPALARLLAPASSTVAWRAATGECDSPLVVQRTDNGGATWVDYPVQAEGARSLLGLSAVDDSSVRAVAGVGEACDPAQFESFSLGQFWQPAGEPAGFWHVAPLEPGVVVAPDGAAVTPCEEVSGLAWSSASDAAVACTDGSLLVTTDSGATWADVAPGGATVAVAATAVGYIAAIAGVEGCDGLQIGSVAGDGVEPLSCVPADPTEPAVLTGGGDALWLWAGDSVLVSADGGGTWAG